MYICNNCIYIHKQFKETRQALLYFVCTVQPSINALVTIVYTYGGLGPIGLIIPPLIGPPRPLMCLKKICHNHYVENIHMFFSPEQMLYINHYK